TTLYTRPERTLRQGRPYALVVTSRVRDETGQPLRRAKGPAAALDPRLAKHLGALGLTRDDVVASAVFTTASVTAGLEHMRARIDALPAPRIDFSLAPNGGRRGAARRRRARRHFLRRVPTRGPP